MVKNSCERRVIWWKVKRIWWGVVFIRESPPSQASDILSCLLQGHSRLPISQSKIILWGLSPWNWDNTSPPPSQLVFLFFFLHGKYSELIAESLVKSLCLNNSKPGSWKWYWCFKRKFLLLTNDSVLYNPIVPYLLLHDYNSECC